jgi:hypothetical protein
VQEYTGGGGGVEEGGKGKGEERRGRGRGRDGERERKGGGEGEKGRDRGKGREGERGRKGWGEGAEGRGISRLLPPGKLCLQYIYAPLEPTNPPGVPWDICIYHIFTYIHNEYQDRNDTFFNPRTPRMALCELFL